MARHHTFGMFRSVALPLLLVFAEAAPGYGDAGTYQIRNFAEENSQHSIVNAFAQTPPPPASEPIDIVELLLPPVSANATRGACTDALNPNYTGCIARNLASFQAGDFTPDGSSVIAMVNFVGAPEAPGRGHTYDGLQLVLIKADGTNFSNGDSWKCLTCDVPAENARDLDPQRDYPHVFRSGDKAIWGHNILECDGNDLGSDACTPDIVHIYPIYWPNTADGSGPGGAPRELRVHPDDVHMGWSSFTDQGGQYCYLGRLQFNAQPSSGEPTAPRYDLVNVDLLVDPERWAFVTTDGNELQTHPDSITIGELRGFSGSGDEILYIGAPTESTNIDLYAIHMETGVVRRLTSHPDYADPIAFSADDKWFVTQDTRPTERQMWMSGMRGIPPIIDLVATAVAASTRNNGPRRFFQPILIDRFGDRGSYYGQAVNADGDGGDGGVGDPNWNGRADPAFSLDSTRIVYWQAIVTSPSCGGSNPLPCPVSTAEGEREYRIMLASLSSREPARAAPVYKVPDNIPWATKFPPGAAYPSLPAPNAGNYTLRGKVSGCAKVDLVGGGLQVGGNTIKRVAINYTDYSDDGYHILNGWEDVQLTVSVPNMWAQRLDWYSDIVQTGIVEGSKRTSANGLHLSIDVMTNILMANGTLTTILDGVEYHQPPNGT